MRRRGRLGRSIAQQFARDYLAISLVPLLLLLLVTVVGGLAGRSYLSDVIQRSTADVEVHAYGHLQRLGQQIIRAKARDVARQIEIHLQSHAEATMAELQGSAEFRRLSMQKVGNTGYTCLYEAPSGVMRIHPNGRLIDKDMSFLAQSLPSWWAIYEPTLAGVEVSGYYDWIDATGQRRKKFMTMTPVGRKLGDVTLMIAATTYIEEFAAPTVAMQKRAADVATRYRRFVTRNALYLAAGTVVLLVIGFLVVYWLGRRAAFRYIRPIQHLAAAARLVGEGDFERTDETQEGVRGDEIGALKEAFTRMRSHLKRSFAKLNSQLHELKAAEAALKESEEHYRTLFNGVPVGLYRSKPDGELLDANQCLVEMLGYPDKESLLKRTATGIYVDPKDRTRWQQQMKSNGGAALIDVRMYRHDGSVFWAQNHSRMVTDAADQPISCEGSIKDITESRRAEEALRDSEEKFRELYEDSQKVQELYRSLLSSSADAIAICDLKLCVTYLSAAATKLFDWRMDELKGRPLPLVEGSSDSAKATSDLLRELVRHGRPTHGFETQGPAQDGSALELSISASRFDDHAGQPAGILVVLRDVSDRKELETRLLRAQKMEAIGTLAGGVAHDFNNLMMGISGNVSIVLRDLDEAHPHHRRLKSIESQIQHGSRLTSQLLGYARKGKYEVKSIDLNALVKERVEAFVRVRREIDIRLELCEVPWVVEADEGQLEQVLLNLFVNAADAMPRGGTLSLVTDSISHDELVDKPFEVAPGTYVVLKVCDTGMGMEESTLERIFDPFFTTKAMGRGTGLGLASVYGIVKLHDGHIEVASQPGKGTTFTIYLPARSARPRRVSEARQPVARGTGTVLLVDDEPMVLRVCREMLGILGYDVLVAASGSEALETYAREGARIDLVILDMIMPGMSGEQVFHGLKELGKSSRILLASGYSLEGQASEIMNQGCDGFIQKPFKMEALAQKVRDILVR